MKPLKPLFETLLWRSRLIVIWAVVASLVSSIILFVIATIDVGWLVVKTVSYLLGPGGGEGYDAFHSNVISHVITAVDDYLLATVLLIFALGLYGLSSARSNRPKKTLTAARGFC